MLNWRGKSDFQTALAQFAAINKSQAVIEFLPNGTIVTANKNFLSTFGYTLQEIQGKHHSMFVEADVRSSAVYRAFWATLSKGECQSAEYKRMAKDGREVWIQACYNPVLDANEKPVKVIKFATDITSRKIQSMEDAGKIAAIVRSQAVVEFAMDGTIVTANSNFLDTMGYRLGEIQGKHHGMFVEPAERDSIAYHDFWADMRAGKFHSAEYKRIGKGGKEVWIMATYNPIFDEKGKPFKIVKFATDITEQKLLAADNGGQIAAIGKSQAVIEFAMDGTIITANRNFLDTMGYELREIQGHHHSMFVEPAERSGEAYRDFWAKLKRGMFQAAEYRRIGKGGREVWIQASYNPIFDLNGQPFKVVKYATDITAQSIARIKSERARFMIAEVATGTEKMNTATRDISLTMTRSKQTAGSAAAQVDQADSQAQRLSSAARSMSGIVELIGHITGQINLLALNATIESARAGEAGRGFAVVASEVKTLANQAREATQKIITEIEGLNEISSDVVGALGAIRQAFLTVSECVNATAAAVDMQSATTSDMASNIQRASAELA